MMKIEGEAGYQIEVFAEDSLKRLAVQIIDLAVKDALKISRNRNSTMKRKKAFYKKTATEWIFDNSKDAFSFYWCCEVVGLNGIFIRRKLKQMLGEENEKNISVAADIEHDKLWRSAANNG
jgi:hypothetical protein